jgi:hypothetical protein
MAGRRPREIPGFAETWFPRMSKQGSLYLVDEQGRDPFTEYPPQECLENIALASAAPPMKAVMVELVRRYRWMCGGAHQDEPVVYQALAAMFLATPLEHLRIRLREFHVQKEVRRAKAG